jgi:chromosome condensin MukBEF complex kleisin-like MukF subunit
MNAANSAPTRFIGMDIHKHYFAAVGVDADQNVVFGPHQGTIQSLETWAEKNLTLNDAVVIEMTTNTYAVHDALRRLGHRRTPTLCGAHRQGAGQD